MVNDRHTAFRLTDYDSRSFGPLFAVSDEGSAGAAVVDAAYASAKARALPRIDPLRLGVILDGERMTSAGEVPIGPDEYAALSAAAGGRLLCTTNVGVRANARPLQLPPELPLPQDAGSDRRWVEDACARFARFIDTPDGHPRPRTVRLSVPCGEAPAGLASAVEAIEAARAGGRIGPRDLHRLALLAACDDPLDTAERIRWIETVIGAAADAGLTEVAIDGALRPAARVRFGVQSLLNVLDPERARALLRTATTRGVRLTYRYQLDVESAARTIWTGLHAARTQGLAAGKYGLTPMTLPEQRATIELVSRWMRDWSAIPAFYVDTPLVTDDDVLDAPRCAEAASMWLAMARDAGASVVLFDSPDRVTPRRLLRESEAADDKGVLSLADVDRLLEQARDLKLDILWSGGITPGQAFELAKRGVHGIFSTSSTARRVPVSKAFADDAGLPAENEPTERGVRRMHAIIQGGFLGGILARDEPALAASITTLAGTLLAAEADAGAERALRELDDHLTRGWRAVGSARALRRADPPAERPTSVPPDAVRVFRGRRRASIPEGAFLQKLGTVFMPITAQMQRLYGLTAYLPAVLPAGHASELPDEIALVFYRTQDAYHAAKRCVGGRAYGDMHDLVFDMSASASGFPRAFAGAVELDEPYHVFPHATDWQLGSARVYVGTRSGALAPDAFRAEAATRARRLQQSSSIDGAILCVSRDWLICWAHAPGDAPPPPPPFSDVAEPVLDIPSRVVAIPHELSVPYDGLRLSSEGDFVNLRFPRP